MIRPLSMMPSGGLLPATAVTTGLPAAGAVDAGRVRPSMAPTVSGYVQVGGASPSISSAGQGLVRRKIIIVSESAHSDPAVQQFRRRFIEMGLEGKACLVAEGATLENSDGLRDMFARKFGIKCRRGSLVFGLEREHSHAITGLLKAVKFYHPERTSDMDEEQWEMLNRQVLDRFVLPLLRTYPSLREAWRRLAPQISSERRNLVHRRIDQFVAAAEKGVATNRQVMRTRDIGYATRVNITLCELAKSYAELLVERPDLRDGLELPAQLAKDLAGQSWLEIEMGDFDRLIVRWRNRGFARSLQEIMRRPRSRDVPVIIMVGRAHVAFLKRFIRKEYGIVPKILTAEDSDAANKQGHARRKKGAA